MNISHGTLQWLLQLFEWQTKDLQGSLGVSLTHYSKLGLRTLVVFLACYPMTEILQIENS